jgi:sulfatase modifying factor 1
MYRYLIYMLCIDLILISTAFSQRLNTELERIAVLYLENQSVLNQSEVQFLHKQIQSIVQIQMQGRYKVITEENINLLLPGNQKLEDCEGECEVDIGRQIGAHLLIVGEIVRYGQTSQNLRLVLRMTETKEGSLINSVTIKGSNADQIESLLNQALIDLLSVLKKKSPKIEQIELDPALATDEVFEVFTSDQHKKSAHQKNIDQEWQQILEQRQVGDLNTTKQMLEAFLSKYQQHPLGNHRLADAGGLLNQLTLQEDREKQAILEAIHYSKVKQAYEFAKPFIEVGDRQAKKALDSFLSKYQNHPFANPFAKEAQDLYEKMRLKYDRSLKRQAHGIDWILIQGGTFMMGNHQGNHDEKPVHRVEIKDFYLSKTEVTVAQYRLCVQAGICRIVINPKLNQNCNYASQGKDQHPINCISWQQARTFAKWVGGDLPSEAQWEYAARSQGQDFKYPWGNQEEQCTHAIMNHGRLGCGQESTGVVCLKAQGRTKQGLCDMAGNVWEWVLDEWRDSYQDATSLENAWCSQVNCDEIQSTERVVRGGGWVSFLPSLRSTARMNQESYLLKEDIGFRVYQPAD